MYSSIVIRHLFLHRIPYHFTFNQMETLIFLLIKITHLIMFKAIMYIYFLIRKQHDLF